MARPRSKSRAVFKWRPFSPKQLKLLTWWTEKSPYKDYDIILCDGSIRAGKTVAMIDSFITWSLHSFPQGGDFIISGRTMGSLKRNVLNPMFTILNAKGISYQYNRSDHYIIIGPNTYYCFGASTEASQDAIQGMTASGALGDEVALFPESFVDQMLGRCSVHGSKIWLNCNPKGPYHYIKTEFIDKAVDKKILHLHFTLDDNPSLSPAIKDRYKRMFSGVFYKRYILGLWVMAEGLVYDMFDHEEMIVDTLPEMTRYYVGVDYGTSNATTFILSGIGSDGKLYIIKEYYHSGRESMKQKSPSEYADDFAEWVSSLQDSNGNQIHPHQIFIDPSAQGFIIELWRRNVRGIAKADNDVKRGIELVSSIMATDNMRVHVGCKNVLRELSSYVWDEKAQERGEDVPMKAFDHTLDPIRYTANGTRLLWQRKGVV